MMKETTRGVGCFIEVCFGSYWIQSGFLDAN